MKWHPPSSIDAAHYDNAIAPSQHMTMRRRTENAGLDATARLRRQRTTRALGERGARRSLESFWGNGSQDNFKGWLEHGPTNFYEREELNANGRSAGELAGRAIATLHACVMFSRGIGMNSGRLRLMVVGSLSSLGCNDDTGVRSFYSLAALFLGRGDITERHCNCAIAL